MAPEQMGLSMQHRGGFERFAKATHRAVSLGEVDRMAPWAVRRALIERLGKRNKSGSWIFK